MDEQQNIVLTSYASEKRYIELYSSFKSYQYGKSLKAHNTGLRLKLKL